MREHDKRSLCLCAVPLLLLSACASELSSDATNIEEPPEVSVVKQPLLDQPIDTLTFNLTADTSIVGGFGTTNRNYGTQKSLPVNRGLVMADSATLSSAWTPHGGDYIVSAKLRLSVNSGLISLPRILSAYRVIKPWTETGATWNCAIDSIPSNSSQDCAGATKWSNAGGDVDTTATGSVVLPLAIGSSTVEIDVSEDVRAFKDYFDNEGQYGQANYGWLLKTLTELPLDPTSFASRESTTPPKLVLQVRRCNAVVCNDGIACSQDITCSDEGLCGHLTAPPGSPCNDNNACTISDSCSGTDFTCAGTPAPVGTPCGSGLECDAQQQCVPASPQ